jgi:hypothetical protein
MNPFFVDEIEKKINLKKNIKICKETSSKILAQFNDRIERYN